MSVALPTDFCLSRRKLLTGAAATLAFSLLPGRASSSYGIPERSIGLTNPYTGELVVTKYWENGEYIREAMDEIGYILRDKHNEKVTRVDPELLNLLVDLRRTLRTREPFQVVCGYRSPETNRMLRKAGTAAAKESLHMHGQAIDIRLKSRNAGEIRKAALSLQRGGVGYYPASNFVHVDTGSVRSW
jgi:uncharacterized protein YcbK (DUF882 family)